MACWIRHILPLLDNSKKDELIQTVLCKVKHTSLFDTMAILSAVVASFGFAPVCNHWGGTKGSYYSSVITGEKCACVNCLVHSLIYILEHQTELDGLTSDAAERRLRLFEHACLLGASVLQSLCEPWLTFQQSPAKNRLYTVLKVIAVDFPIRKELTQQINGTASCYVIT